MGLFEFIDNSQIFIDAKDEAIERALEAIGITAEGYAKLKCPVDTGRLRNSISHTHDKDSVYIGTNVEYAVYVEMGTINSPAQPYLKPAVTGHHAEYKRIAESCLRGT